MADQKNVSFTPANLHKLLRGQVNEAQIQNAFNYLLAAKDI